MKKLCSLALCAAFTFTSLFGAAANGLEQTPPPTTNRDAQRHQLEALRDQRNDVRDKIKDVQDNIRDKRDELRDSRPGGVPATVYKDVYERRDFMKDRIEDHKDKKEELKDQRDALRDKMDSVRDGVYGKRPGAQDEINARQKAVREQVYARQQGVREQVYARQQALQDRREKIDEMKDKLKEMRKATLEARKELIRQIVEEKRIKQKAKMTSVFLNNTDLEFDDVQPQIINSRTFIPLRKVSEAMNAKVDWDSSTQTITIVKSVYGAVYGAASGSPEAAAPKTITVLLKLGSNEITVDGVKQTIDAPAFIFEGRTMVPIRFIADALKKKVAWDAESGSVIIDDEDE